MEEAVEHKGWVWLMREMGGLCEETLCVVVMTIVRSVKMFELEMPPWLFVASRAPFFLPRSSSSFCLLFMDGECNSQTVFVRRRGAPCSITNFLQTDPQTLQY